MELKNSYKVGDVARRTGLTVRTLHYYHEIGLLIPSLRTDAGHRLYTPADLARLQQIKSLQQLGFTLKEIAGLLGRPDFQPAAFIHRLIERIDRQIEHGIRLRRRLESLIGFYQGTDTVPADDLLQTIKEMIRMEKYYSPEQLDLLKKRRETLGKQAILGAEKEWEEIFARYREEMEKGTPPDDPVVKELARRSRRLIAAFSGGDPGIETSLAKMYRTEGGPKVLAGHGLRVDSRVWEFMGSAIRALGEKKPRP
jgi:DNA-binding transcriptional MerR regulator